MPIGRARGCSARSAATRTPWTIVMPPPNVTGCLHIGHALDITLQDVLTRRERMLGKDALWVVGTDHAGIATQMVVERQLEERQASSAPTSAARNSSPRCGSGRQRAGGAITRQLRRLGASCDWAHERFTMDERYQRAVTHTFVELHKRGLSIATSGWSIGTPGSRPRSATSRSRPATSRASSGPCSYPLADGSRRDRGRDHAAGDDARRHGGRGSPGRRALHGADRQAAQAPDHRPADPDHRRRACRPRAWQRRGQDHARPRLQRFRGRQARRVQARRHAQHVRRPRRAWRADRRRPDPGGIASASTARTRASGGRAARSRRRAGPGRGPRSSRRRSATARAW